MQEQLGVFWGVDVALDHARLARAACERGLLVFVLNPGDVRHYARSVGPGADHLGAGAGSAQRGAALISVFERLGPCSADAVIAMTGFDPRPMDSGRKTGARRLSKRGPAELRRLLYVAAGVLAWTAVKMMSSEPLLRPCLQVHPVVALALYLVIALVLWLGCVKNHR